ncbi:hypothetical protein [Halocatena pleomorpha]|uniref:Histidine kinase n=1 Tax=Halocatena pleomorpha TaxID=1785090 RepID=A0A3P3RER9_9EURY|nr:hypothetical protein [Halocatena pleomorpha]RRJ31834.1 hypothetical protein EIK79_06100 [Halocatena pleomorpha]
MNAQAEDSTKDSIGGSLNWLLGGAVGGVVGALIFGGLLWMIDPEIVIETIPAIYGLSPAGPLGWVFHLTHGLVLGIVFGFLVSRSVIFTTLTADVETDIIATTGPRLRFIAAGIVYGLAVWTVLPVTALSIWIAVGGVNDPAFPATAIESLLGHVLYGLLLGALFSILVDITPEAEESDAPFREASDPPRK